MDRLRVFVVCCFLFGVRGQQTDSCNTPNQRPGRCIPLKGCPSLMGLLQSNNLSAKERELLQKSQCGYQDSQPKVCCPTANADDQMRLLPDTNVCGLQEYVVHNGPVQAHIREFPWSALLEYERGNKRDFFCGGTLINSRYILTAAHCVAELEGGWKLASVRLGENNLDTEKDCYVHTSQPTVQYCTGPPLNIPIEEVIAHSKYDRNDYSQPYDIALLRLKEEVAFNEYISPICLPTGPDDIGVIGTNTRLTLAGWAVFENDLHSAVKLKSRASLVSYDSCSAVYSTLYVNLRDQLCLEVSNCTTDGGGAVMLNRKTSTGYNWYIAGLYSFGATPCGNNNWPDVYTRVTSYFRWLLSNLKP